MGVPERVTSVANSPRDLMVRTTATDSTRTRSTSPRRA